MNPPKGKGPKILFLKKATHKRLCVGCLSSLDLGCFYGDRSKGGGVWGKCKQCISTEYKLKRLNNPEYAKRCRERSKEWRKNNPERSWLGVRDATIRAKYGINLKQYNDLLKKQNYRCAICETPDAPRGRGQRRSFHIDHNHITKKIRGLLCQSCNTTLGHMKESAELLIRAAKYLQKQ